MKGGGTYFPGIQVLRGFAALLVVFQHAGFFGAQSVGIDYRTFMKVDFGALGVLMFFTISGFVIGLNRHLPTSIFVIRRILRIYPAFWAAYALSAAIVLQVGRHTDFWWWTAFLLPTTTFPSIYVPAWTLVFEVFFYAFAAILFSLRLSDRTMTFIALAWILAIHAMQPYVTGSRYYLPGPVIPFAQYNQFFALGLICALNWEMCSRVSINQFLVVAIAATASLSLLPPLPHASTVLVMGVALSSILLVSTRTSKVPKLAEALGDASYGLFLLHHSVIVALSIALARFGIPIPLLVAILFAAGLAVGVPFGFLEHRFYRMTSRHIRRVAAMAPLNVRSDARRPPA